jgi:HEAT repeat protein
MWFPPWSRLGQDPDEDIREAAAFALKQVQAGTP